MNSKPPYYRIYLLTVWQERSRGPPGSNTESITWRFRLEDPRTGRQQAFADAASLMATLSGFAMRSEEEESQGEKEELDEGETINAQGLGFEDG